MAKHSSVDPILKVQLVEKYLRNEITLSEGTRQAGVSSRAAFRRWVRIYEKEGPTGLMKRKQKRHYPTELRLAAVLEYLTGGKSLNEISKKYGLRSEIQLQTWLKEYNTHGEIRNRESGGGSCMSKVRKTTPEERLEIVKDCLANGRNYRAMAQKYNCSYHQIRNWVLHYEEMGPAGLEDRRGYRAGTKPPRTPEEELRYKIAELERRNRDLQMENDLLKKVRELEMRDRCL